jgi:hypothetical protein
VRAGIYLDTTSHIKIIDCLSAVGMRDGRQVGDVVGVHGRTQDIEYQWATAHTWNDRNADVGCSFRAIGAIRWETARRGRRAGDGVRAGRIWDTPFTALHVR